MAGPAGDPRALNNVLFGSTIPGINDVDLAQDDDLFEGLTLAVARGEMGKDQVAELLRKAGLA